MRWLFLVLFAIPMGLAFHPSLPNHGYGAIWWIVPLLFWKRYPAQRRRLGLYALAVVLQTLAFPDPDWGFLGWVLLVPYLLARELDDGATWWRAAFAFGFFRAFAGYYWLGNIHFSAWIAVAFLSAAGFTFVFEWFVRRAHFVPYPLRVALGWAAFEWYHAVSMGGFPWLYLSHSQYLYLPVIQVVDLVGAAGLSFLMAFVQAAVARPSRRRVMGAAAVVIAMFVYGTLHWAEFGLSSFKGPPQPVVAMVQTKQVHSVKRTEQMRGVPYARHLADLTKQAVLDGKADLILWPETIAPFPYVESGGSSSRFDLAYPRMVARRMKLPLIAGVNSYTSMERKHRGHNSAVLIDKDGEVKGLYRKQRLVPMGEEFLLRKVLSDEAASKLIAWLVKSIGYNASSDLERGDGYQVLDAGPGLRCAVLICFEGLYPDMGRRAAAQKDVDLIVHLVNNGWFGDSFEQRQAVASWVMRAVETRTPFFSCANGGISCAIGPDGTILKKIDRVMEEGVMAARVPPRGTALWFGRGGEYAVLVLGVVSCVFFGVPHWRDRRSKG